MGRGAFHRRYPSNHTRRPDKVGRRPHPTLLAGGSAGEAATALPCAAGLLFRLSEIQPNSSLNLRSLLEPKIKMQQEWDPAWTEQSGR